MKVIGLTGGIGTGKSTVASILRELGAFCIDLDAIGHDMIKSGTAIYTSLINEFGDVIIAANGQIDRSALGHIVFNDPSALARLNAIVHPAIDAVVAKSQEECIRQGIKVMVIEAAAMLENRRQWQADEIWITVASEKTVLERLARRSGYSEKEALSRIHSQMPEEERRRLADVIIDTDCSLEELRSRVVAEWHRLLQRI